MRQGSEEHEELQPTKPPKGLLRSIFSRIYNERRLRAKKQTIYFSIAAAGLIAATVAALWALHNISLASGTEELVSVAAYDPGAIIANWREFGMFFLETLPIGSLMIFLVALIAALASLKKVARYAAVAFAPAKY